MEEMPDKDTRSRYTERQLAAAGEVALDLRHALNNPLAALMAEAQLLAMEPLQPEHRAAVDRIIDLCRRTVNLIRGLDAATRAANDA
jgi:nitrogen-specific signal transduction histidine kinase